MRRKDEGPGSKAELACIEAGAAEAWRSLKGRAEGMLQGKRLAHSLAVADESVIMGLRFGGDPVRLALAGLVHDGAKRLDDGELIAIGEAEGLIGDPAQRESPSLLHGPVGAWLAEHEWGISDPVILESIRYHTTGEADMGLEACIVFMADLVEPGRDYDGVEVLRKMCREDLRAAMIEAIEQTFVYLERKKQPVHAGTARCLAWLKEERGIPWTARN